MNVMIGFDPARRALRRRSCGLRTRLVSADGSDMAGQRVTILVNIHRSTCMFSVVLDGLIEVVMLLRISSPRFPAANNLLTEKDEVKNIRNIIVLS